MALTRTALVGFSLCLGCAPLTAHRPDPNAAAPTHLERVQSDWLRLALPAEGITIAATLWDASLVASALADSRNPAARTAWAQRYLQRTAFTVVIELEDRQPVFDSTPLLKPDGWIFGLALNKGDPADSPDVLAPLNVDLLLVDRFPTDSGAYHHRVAMVVFFEGTLHEAAKKTEVVALTVRPQISEPEHGRGMLGAPWAKRGTTLRWHVEAQDGPGSPPVEH